MSTKFSEILKHLIETCKKPDGTKYTVEEIGVAIDYSGSHVRKLLNGQSKPGYEVVEKLATFFNVDPNFLFGWQPKDSLQELKHIEEQIAFRKTDENVTSDIRDMLRIIVDFIEGEKKHESNPSGAGQDQGAGV